MNSVNLENCDVEPIHVPGHIQPHGALLAFDGDGTMAAWSANAEPLLCISPALDARPGTLALEEGVRELIEQCIAESAGGAFSPGSLETTIGARQFDLIVHGHEGRVIAEFEAREQSADEVAAFALKAHRAIDRMRRQRTAESLLESAVAEVRALTGFDRVMAYKFRHDESGEIVAEARDASLEANLGRRYPASDIPSQARRLYTINTLRLIGDVNYLPVPLLGNETGPAVDMSHCVLRSVSPIHIEYLQNMGVGASMSISIVVNGRLWGMLACHHMTARQVPYSIRMACDVLAQVMSATIQSHEARALAAMAEKAAVVRTRLLADLLQADDVMSALVRHEEAVRESLGAEALIICQSSRVLTFGDVPESLSAAIVGSLPAKGGELLQRTQVAEWPSDIQPLLGKWVGLLGLHFDPGAGGWLLALRPEQIETVRWGGRPDKVLKTGPLGPRLTPRGSFGEWRETVRDRAEPWDEGRIGLARELLAEMHRASNTRHAEIERARTHLIAMLGHDLRDPLQSISMAAGVLKRGAQQENIGQRIEASSGRMQRLISQVLDMSRAQGGGGLSFYPTDTDLVRLITDLIDEMHTAHPGTEFNVAMPPTAIAKVDSDRIGQVVGNLLSNARHHGEAGKPVRLALDVQPRQISIHVSNRGEPIPAEIASDLFSPFKRHSADSTRNRSGLGLGLYIAHQIVIGHAGTIEYTHDGAHVIFKVTLPIPADKTPAEN